MPATNPLLDVLPHEVYRKAERRTVRLVSRGDSLKNLALRLTISFCAIPH
jgi:hypothetical protein